MDHTLLGHKLLGHIISYKKGMYYIGRSKHGSIGWDYTVVYIQALSSNISTNIGFGSACFLGKQPVKETGGS